jgi:hypothetical protein
MKRLLILISYLVLLFSVALTLTHILGATRPSVPDSFAMMLNRDVQLIDGVWCWRRLCPGKTTADQVFVTLTDGIVIKYLVNPGQMIWRPYRGSSWSANLFYDYDNVLTFIGISTDNSWIDFLPELMMADIVAMYGEPTRIGVNTFKATFRSVVYPCYEQGLCVRTVPWGRPQLRMMTQLDTVNLMIPQIVSDHLAQANVRVGWLGFADYLAQP